jgi:hypothetical protein
MQEVLGEYVNIAGKPFMVPIYALGLGDSDCYHNERHGNSTQTVVALADKYREQVRVRSHARSPTTCTWTHARTFTGMHTHLPLLCRLRS